MEKNNNLKNKTALITGGIKRIGQATALALARQQADIILHYNRSPEAEVQKLIAQIQALGVQARAFQADLNQPEQVQNFFQKLTQKIELTQPVDYLINNASIFVPSPLEDLGYEILHKNLMINAIAPLQLCQQFARQTGTGCIINFLDTRITGHDLKYSAYQLSKNMLHDLTRMMAQAYAPRIRVNAVAPGLILPPPGKDEDYLTERHSVNLLNRHGSVDDITTAVIFLLKQSFITGQVLFIDGGQHIKGAAV